jgi:hypothetical protein
MVKTMTMAAILFAVVGSAHADQEQVVHHAELTAVASGGKPCDAIIALGDVPMEKPTCKKVASKKVKGVGTAVLYALGTPKDGFVRYAIVVDGKLVSPPVDLMEDDAMGGKHVGIGKITPKLRAITVSSVPAVALDVTTKLVFTETDMDSGKQLDHHAFQRYDYVVCNGTSCMVSGFGGAFEACHASLSNDGVLTHACDEDTELMFVK